jgi:hypothetical protein
MQLPDNAIVVRIRRPAAQPDDTRGYSSPVVRMVRFRRQSVRVPRRMRQNMEPALPLPVSA